MHHFQGKINTCEVFSKSGHQVFLKLFLIADIKNWVKMTVSISKEKSYYALSGEIGHFWA